MIFTVERGTLHVGHAVATALKLKNGQQTTLRDRSFTVQATLAETGSRDDVRVYANLDDVQELLGGSGVDRWDAIMLDVDNGPDATCRDANNATPAAAVITFCREHAPQSEPPSDEAKNLPGPSTIEISSRPTLGSGPGSSLDVPAE